MSGSPGPTPPAPSTAEIAAALAALRAEVHTRRAALASDNNAALDAIEQQLQRCAEQLEITRVISAHWPLEGGSVPQRALNLVNKVVRRGLRWYINPIVDQQNAFNDMAARTLRLLIDTQHDLRRQLAELEPPANPAAPAGPAASDSTPTLSAPLANRAIRDSLPDDTAALQMLVNERGAHEPPAHFPELSLVSLPGQLATVQTIDAHWAFPNQTAVQRAQALIMRVLRQYLRWLINPLVEQQNACNAAISATIPALLKGDVELRVELAARHARSARRR